MHARSRLFRAVRFANAAIFIVAIGFALDHSVAGALARITGNPHWSMVAGPTTVIDKTGDAAWHRASQYAVATWNRAAAGTGLELAWTAGTGACEPQAGVIVLCGASSASLDDDLRLSRQGVARIEIGTDRAQTHIGQATVLVCADCRIDEARRRVVAAHELGHAVGLPHVVRNGSIMHPLGGPEAPDPLDVEALRALYTHVDKPDHCGHFNARLGPLCF